MKEVVREKLADALALELPELTRRTSVHVPAVAGKAKAVIGMRRAGKTSLSRSTSWRVFPPAKPS